MLSSKVNKSTPPDLASRKMLMAPNSFLMKFQEGHQQGFILEPSVPDMAYPPQQHDDQPVDVCGIFKNRSFTGVTESKCALPTYQEAVKSNMNGGRMYASPSRRDLCCSDFNNNGSNSPSAQNFATLDASVPAHMNHRRHSGSHSRLSPPPKRSTSNAANHYPVERSMSPSPSGAEYESSGFLSANDHCEEMQLDNFGCSSRPIKFGGMSVVPMAERKVFESLHPLQAAAPPSEDDDKTLSFSPERHRSVSSTHSSGDTPIRTASVKQSKAPANAQTSQFLFADDDDDSWKICSVCGDKATGYHFNALTCEGCKGFFRRSVKNGKSFTCPYSGNCAITKSNRRQCQACRLHKCLKIGMKKECIMSPTEIKMKKDLMLNNRIKRSVVEWMPLEYTQERRELIELISRSFQQTNNSPDIPADNEVVTVSRNSAASPTSSTNSGFSDLINQMKHDIVSTAPEQAHMQHFSEIMEFSIKEIIKFCKKIPAFVMLSIKDQITLLKSGCTEILFIRANYTYDREEGALMCGPEEYYTREAFILGGMSEEYTDSYLQFHHNLSHERLDDTEMACMCAATLFSSDRDELEHHDIVETQQEKIVIGLQSYTENTYHCRVRFSKIMAYLTRLRTLNWHISKTLLRLKNENQEKIGPLVFEVIPTA